MVGADQSTSQTPTANVAPEPEVPKDMFRVGRRSAVSTSELGLYSDHSDYYNTSINGGSVRKLVIGIMVVVSVVLVSSVRPSQSLGPGPTDQTS
jgi:hypothetical protein